MTAAERPTGYVARPAEVWSYGDLPYGLEPLYLPQPDEPWPHEPALRGDLAEAYAGLERAVRGEVVPTELATEDNLERLYWFRWITGHHISFVIWQLLAAELRGATSAGGRSAAASTAMTDCVRAYSSMLLYTGSCSKPIYNNVIRPSMFRLHHAFSGTWAPDYRAVRALLSGRKASTMEGPGAGSLRREVALSQQIHLGVAAKLVTDGRSLLQELTDKHKVAQRRARSAMFDCCFLTVRVPVPAEEVAVQLLRRFRAVAVDLRTNGMHPVIDGATDELPQELADPAVKECQAGLLDVTMRVSTWLTHAVMDGSYGAR